jgi:hypothetical protein
LRFLGNRPSQLKTRYEAPWRSATRRVVSEFSESTTQTCAKQLKHVTSALQSNRTGMTTSASMPFGISL